MREIGQFIKKNAREMVIGTTLVAGGVGVVYEASVREGKDIAPIVQSVKEFDEKTFPLIPECRIRTPNGDSFQNPKCKRAPYPYVTGGWGR